jgi:hypothetical protein
MMRVLIVSVGRRVLGKPLVEAATSLRECGAIVDLVSWHMVDKDLCSTFDHVVVLGPHGFSPEATRGPVNVVSVGAEVSEVTATMPANTVTGGIEIRKVTTMAPARGAERVRQAIAWRYRKYISRPWRRLNWYRKHASRVLRRKYRKNLSRARRRLNWHAQSAWRRFAAHPDAVRLSRGCAIVAAADADAVLIVWHIARRRPDVVAVNGLGALSSFPITSLLPLSSHTSQSGNFSD